MNFFTLFQKRKKVNHLVALKKELTKPIIVITYDDGIYTDYTIGYPEMKNRGLKGTSYINGNDIGDSARLDWGQVIELDNSDYWDIQCHSYNHTNLTELTEEEVHQEMQNQNQIFVDNGLEEPQHHAYPYGDYNSTVQDIVREYRKTTRRTHYEPRYDHNYRSFYNSCTGGNIKSLNCDLESQDDLDYVEEQIDLTIEENNILFLYGHQILNDYEDLWLDMFDYIEQANITSMTVSEVYNYILDYKDKFF